MKFGLFTIVPWHESVTQEQALRDAMEQIELADQLGVAGKGFNSDTVGKKPAGDVLAGVAEGAGNDVKFRFVGRLVSHDGA